MGPQQMDPTRKHMMCEKMGYGISVRVTRSSVPSVGISRQLQLESELQKKSTYFVRLLLIGIRIANWSMLL